MKKKKIQQFKLEKNNTIKKNVKQTHSHKRKNFSLKKIYNKPQNIKKKKQYTN